MKVHINTYIDLYKDGITLNEVNIEMDETLALYLYKNRGEAVDIDDAVLTHEEIDILFNYAVISNIENYYNLIPNLSYSILALDSVSFLNRKNSSKNWEVGIIEIPYFQGNMKHTYDLETIQKLKNATYKIPNPNYSYMPTSKEDNRRLLRQIVDYGFLKINDKQIMQKEIQSVSYEIHKEYPFTIPLYVGGDHSISYPIVKGIRETFEEDIIFLYLDSHLDISNDKVLTNSNVIKKIMELEGVEIINYGANSPLFYEEYSGIDNLLLIDNLNDLIEVLKRKNKPIYLSIDCDVFNSYWLPNITFPGAFGIEFKDYLQLLDLFEKMKLKVLGCDIVELNTHNSSNEYGLVNAGYVLYSTLQFLAKIKG